MQTQNTKQSPDFTKQNIYVGIDTHYKTWMVSVSRIAFYVFRVCCKTAGTAKRGSFIKIDIDCFCLFEFRLNVLHL